MLHTTYSDAHLVGILTQDLLVGYVIFTAHMRELTASAVHANHLAAVE
jgi:hypothetical protein